MSSAAVEAVAAAVDKVVGAVGVVVAEVVVAGVAAAGVAAAGAVVAVAGVALINAVAQREDDYLQIDASNELLS